MRFPERVETFLTLRRVSPQPINPMKQYNTKIGRKVRVARVPLGNTPYYFRPMYTLPKGQLPVKDGTLGWIRTSELPTYKIGALDRAGLLALGAMGRTLTYVSGDRRSFYSELPLLG